MKLCLFTAYRYDIAYLLSIKFIYCNVFIEPLIEVSLNLCQRTLYTACYQYRIHLVNFCYLMIQLFCPFKIIGFVKLSFISYYTICSI